MTIAKVMAERLECGVYRWLVPPRYMVEGQSLADIVRRLEYRRLVQPAGTSEDPTQKLLKYKED